MRVHPVHHLRSASVAGPYARSHRRAISVRASAAGTEGQGSVWTQRYWLEVHEPRGRSRRIRPSAASSRMTRVATPCSVSYFLPRPMVIFWRSAGTAADSWLPVEGPRASRASRAAASAPAEPRGVQSLSVLVEALEEGAALLRGDRAGGGGVDVRGEFGGDREERVAHAEQAHEAYVLVERPLDHVRAASGEPRPGREEDGRGVGGVQGDDGVRRLRDGRGAGRRSQTVAPAEPVASLGGRDEREAHPPDRRPGRRRGGPACRNDRQSWSLNPTCEAVNPSRS